MALFRVTNGRDRGRLAAVAQFLFNRIVADMSGASKCQLSSFLVNNKQANIAPKFALCRFSLLTAPRIVDSKDVDAFCACMCLWWHRRRQRRLPSFCAFFLLNCSRVQEKNRACACRDFIGWSARTRVAAYKQRKRARALADQDTRKEATAADLSLLYMRFFYEAIATGLCANCFLA